jgi:hypothetical protein
MEKSRGHHVYGKVVRISLPNKSEEPIKNQRAAF